MEDRMRRGEVRVALLVLVVVATENWSEADAAAPVSDNPSPEFANTLQAVHGRVPPADRQAALERLAAEPSWEPYLRAALNTTTERSNREALRRALIANQDRLFSWNLERAKDWAKQLRFDYLTDLAAATDDTDRAALIANKVIDMQRVVHDKYRALPLVWPGGRPPPPASTFLVYPDFAAISRQDGFRRLSGGKVEIPKEQSDRPAFIHGGSGVIAAPKARIWISLTSAQLADAAGAEHPTNWVHSVLCANSSARLSDGLRCLFVCDGDVELSHPGISEPTFYGCVIVANGNVTGGDESLYSSTFVYTAGDFTGRKVRSDFSVSIMAAGKIDPPPPAGHPLRKHFQEGVKENPLGIRFVSPADAGMDLAVKKAELRLGSLASNSPLRAAGLEVGDRVLKLNGLHVKTAADFRRQLRESLLWGTGLFEIKRGDQTFLRLVKFAEPPKK
jgi:hypothetical protein